MLALIRDAFREHLKRLAIRELEQRDRKSTSHDHKETRNFLIGNGRLRGQRK